MASKLSNVYFIHTLADQDQVVFLHNLSLARLLQCNYHEIFWRAIYISLESGQIHIGGPSIRQCSRPVDCVIDKRAYGPGRGLIDMKGRTPPIPELLCRSTSCHGHVAFKDWIQEEEDHGKISSLT